MNNTETQLHHRPLGEQVKKKPRLLRCQISLSWKMSLLTAVLYMLEAPPRLGNGVSRTLLLNAQAKTVQLTYSQDTCRTGGG